MKIAIYARVSTIDKHQDTGLQLHDLEAYASARGWTNCAQYIDEGVSGSKDSRPALNRLMDDCKKGRITHILVWRLDRFSRSIKHLINTIEELEHLGVTLISFKENLDMGSPAGRLMVHMIAAFGEFERNIIRERVKAGLANAKRKGVILGAKAKPLDLDRVKLLKARGQYIKERIAFLQQRNEPTDEHELGRLKRESLNYSLRAIAKEVGVSTETVRRRS